MTPAKLAELAKAVTAAIGVLTVILASALLHGSAATEASSALGLLTIIATYLVPNKIPSVTPVLVSPADPPAGSPAS